MKLTVTNTVNINYAFPICSRFKCEQCGEEFDKNNQYQRHLAGHSGLKPYPCDLCDKRFLYPNKLRLHLLTHSKTHSCTVCEEKFNDFQAVRKHMAMTHNKVKPCVHCGKEFKSRSLMNDHMRTHDTVRTAFECPEENCDK